MGLLWAVLLAGEAVADPTDIYGFGGRSMGMGFGGIAVSQAESAITINPASLYNSMVFFAGYTLIRPSFTPPGPVAWDTDKSGHIDENDSPLDPPWEYPRADGVSFGMVHPLTDQLRFGFNLFLPVDRLLQLYSYDSSLPVWFMYQNRPYRYSAQLGFSADLPKGVRIGGAVHLGYKGDYFIIGTLDASFVGTEDDINVQGTLDLHQTGLDVKIQYSPLVGVYWDVGAVVSPLQGLTLGAVYQHGNYNPITVDVDLQINAQIENIGDLNPMGIVIYAPFDISIIDYFLPSHFGFGLHYSRWERAQFYLDFNRIFWAQLPLSVAVVGDNEVEIPVLFADSFSLENGNAYSIGLRDIWEVKMGFESQWSTSTGLDIIPRFGWGMTPSVLEEVGRNISPLDAPKMAFSTGLGVVHSLPNTSKSIRWDIFGQYHHFLSRKLTVNYDTPTTQGAPLNGDTLQMKGNLICGGIQIALEY